MSYWQEVSNLFTKPEDIEESFKRDVDALYTLIAKHVEHAESATIGLPLERRIGTLTTEIYNQMHEVISLGVIDPVEQIKEHKDAASAMSNLIEAMYNEALERTGIVPQEKQTELQQRDLNALLSNIPGLSASWAR